MKFKCISRADGSRDYIFYSELTMKEFFSLISEISDSFGTNADLISIPEAEIANIRLSNGDIYAKYDVVYGLDIKSTALTHDQEMQLENILLGR